MSKKSKGFTVKPFAEGDAVNYVPGWIGGRLTSPQAQKLAKERMKDAMRDRVVLFAAKDRALADEPALYDENEPRMAFGR